MQQIRVLSAAEQVAGYLRDGVLQGRWEGTMPGGDRLAAELGVGKETMEAALRQLEKEGFLIPQGRRRGRKIQMPEGVAVKRKIRIAILPYEKGNRTDSTMLGLLHQLREAGFDAFFASRDQGELRSDVVRLEKMAKKDDADAWVVVSGSQDVLQWFSGQGLPVFAMYGRHLDFPIAGTTPLKSPAMLAAVERLAGMGHRRIMYLVHEERRKPAPGLLESNFLKALEGCGIQTGAYNLPDWEDNRAGFHRMLDMLFRFSPPTALIVDTAVLFAAARDHLASKGILAPRHISLICTDPDPTFGWCEPSVTHFGWHPRDCLSHVVRWAENTAHGKDDRSKRHTTAEFVEAGTIGPARR